MLDRVEKIQRASGKRLMKKDHEGELRGELVMMLFETADEPAPAPRAAKRRTAKPARAASPRLARGSVGACTPLSVPNIVKKA